MKTYKKSMLIEESDNVAVAVEPIQAGERTLAGGEEITASEYIKEGHKIARVDIEKGAEIIKYGVHIGVATQPIKKGEWVHEHNVYDDFEEINREQRAYDAFDDRYFCGRRTVFPDIRLSAGPGI